VGHYAVEPLTCKASLEYQMPKRRRYSFRKRHFLEPLPTEHNSYISVICESSADGNEPYGNYMLHLADCHRLVEIEFFMGTARARRLSLQKIDKIVQTISQFREALHNECQLIESGNGRKKR
jgi:hypothetical protein